MAFGFLLIYVLIFYLLFANNNIPDLITSKYCIALLDAQGPSSFALTYIELQNYILILL